MAPSSSSVIVLGVLTLLLISVTSYNYFLTNGGIVTATTNTTTPTVPSTPTSSPSQR